MAARSLNITMVKFGMVLNIWRKKKTKFSGLHSSGWWHNIFVLVDTKTSVVLSRPELPSASQSGRPTNSGQWWLRSSAHPVSVTSLERCTLPLTNHVTAIIRSLQHDLTFRFHIRRLWQHHRPGNVDKQILMRQFWGVVSGLNRYFCLFSCDVSNERISFIPKALPSLSTSPSIIEATRSFKT